MKLIALLFSMFFLLSCTAKKDPIVANGLDFEILANTGGDSYYPVDTKSLDISYKITSGDGSACTPYILSVEVNNISKTEWKGILNFKLSVSDTTARFYMPGFMYGRNRGDFSGPVRHPYPRLKAGDVELPFSNYWLVRSDRVTNPISMMFVNNRVIGLSATPYFINKENVLKDAELSPNEKVAQYNGFGCQLDEHKSSVMFTVGYENAPILYIEAATQQKEEKSELNWLKLSSGEKLHFNMYLYAYQASSPEAINEVLKVLYETYHRSPRSAATYLETVQDISDAIYQDAWIPSIKNYGTQVFLKNGSVEYNPLASIGWTGGVEIATPQLMAALRLGDEGKRKQAIECINNIVKNSMNKKSGLPFDAYSDGKWTVNGWWSSQLANKGHSSYLTGHCAYYILKAYDYERQFKNIEHEEWLDFVKSILIVFSKSVDTEGEFPYIFSEEDGKGIEYDSFAGAWCLASLAYYTQITGDSSYLSICQKSEQHYYDKFLSKMECYGTPHDTWKAVDSEGILAYIKATKLLHLITGDKLYLTRLGKGLDYEFTFKFPYNVVQNEQPLKKLGWSSCGGSITSTCNPHIHPMSSNVLDEILYYYQNTKDSYYESRLEDVVLWSLQCHNRYDGEYDYGKKGWMSERFCYSEGLLSERYPNGDKASTWFCFLPWGASNIIEGLCGDLWSLYYKNS